MKHNRPELKAIRRELRKHSTPSERRLWEYLRKSRLGYKFRRQQSIGLYIVDFYCPAAKLIIELDGAYHKENAQQIQDWERDETLISQGFRVLRFPNENLLDQVERVIDEIEACLKENSR